LDIIEFARSLGLRVPRDIAVLSIGNDVIAVLHSTGGITSISLQAEKIGKIAAAVLAKKLRGSRIGSVFVPPGAIVRRGSTDMVTVPDEAVAHAVKFIRLNFARNIGTPEIARHVRLPRRTLEHRFRRLMGCSVGEEIDRCRVLEASEMFDAYAGGTFV
jgi:LacI family transcriptional regulator